MGQHLSDGITSPRCHIISSDNDQTIVMDITIGFNRSEQLMVCVDLFDYEEPEYNCSTAAVVDPDDSRVMASHHRLEHSRLPEFIRECMEDWGEIINPTLTQVKECFKEITDALLEEDCRFKIVRTYGKNDHICC